MYVRIASCLRVPRRMHIGEILEKYERRHNAPSAQQSQMQGVHGTH